MRKNNGLRLGILLIATAMTLRLLATTSNHAEASRAVSLSQDEPQIWVLHRLPPQEDPAPQATFAPFTAAEADAIAIGGKCSYVADKASLLTAPCPVTLGEGPQVLIIHTHTSEAYTQSAGWTYTESDPLRTTDGDHSVVRVGRALQEALEAQGIAVLHDESLNDFPDYNSSYRTTLQKTQKWLEEYPSIRVVLDVHRDAIAEAGGGWVSETVGLRGEPCAQVMLVVGTNEGGADHPSWQSNLNFALKVQASVKREYPALCKPIDLRRERFNQHVLPGAMLVEIGSAGNTLPEALTAADAFGTALGHFLQSCKG